MHSRCLLLSVLLASLLAGCTWPSASRPCPTPNGTHLPQGPRRGAVTHLAAALGVPEAQVCVIAAEAVEWRDSSLGCPEPEMAYLTVITPGYRIILEVAGLRYEVHTNETGRSVAVCE